MVDESYRQYYADLGADYIATTTEWELHQICSAFNILGTLPKKDRDILIYNWFCHDSAYDAIGTDDVKARLTARDPDWIGRLKRIYAMGL